MLAQLRAAGLKVAVEGDQLLVEPRSALTDQLRATIRAHKPAIIRELASEKSFPADLERRIRLMARRWHYAEEELTEVLEFARANPAGWLNAVALDERRVAEFRECGLLPKVDA